MSHGASKKWNGGSLPHVPVAHNSYQHCFEDRRTLPMFSKSLLDSYEILHFDGWNVGYVQRIFFLQLFCLQFHVKLSGWQHLCFRLCLFYWRAVTPVFDQRLLHNLLVKHNKEDGVTDIVARFHLIYKPS